MKHISTWPATFPLQLCFPPFFNKGWHGFYDLIHTPQIFWASRVRSHESHRKSQASRGAAFGQGCEALRIKDLTVVDQMERMGSPSEVPLLCKRMYVYIYIYIWNIYIFKKMCVCIYIYIFVCVPVRHFQNFVCVVYRGSRCINSMPCSFHNEFVPSSMPGDAKHQYLKSTLSTRLKFWTTRKSSPKLCVPHADGIDTSPSKRKIFTDLAKRWKSSTWNWGRYMIPTQTMHVCKGNPSKLPYLCIVCLNPPPKTMG